MTASPLLLGLILFSNSQAGALWFAFIFIVSFAGIAVAAAAAKRNKGKLLRVLLALYIIWLIYQLCMSAYNLAVSGIGFMG